MITSKFVFLLLFFPSTAYLKDCIKGNGKDYRGTQSKTHSGKTCQDWTSTTPHNPNFTPEQYPNAGLEANFCRNPDEGGFGPWCYTTDPTTRYEYCVIPQCEAYFEECIKGNGEDYRGTQSKTHSGKACQKWRSTTPHNPNFTPEKYPNAGLESNFCRNPDGDELGPWCYTTDPSTRYEHCIIPQCKPYLEDCIKDNGKDYRGTQSKTHSGKTCQHWRSTTPHNPNFTPEKYPNAGLEANFCRNPDGDELGPWCYTTNPSTRYEFCIIPQCKPYLEDCIKGIGKDYRGTQSKTHSGKTCQQWISTTPHNPNFTPENYPDAGLESNFCRNPDGDESGPWCYTMDPSTRYEFCIVPQCKPYLEDCIKGNGKDYRGTQSKTHSGKSCQQWRSTTPHNPNFTPGNYPNAGLESNFCRNPDGDESGPWCYTTDPSTRYEHCIIPKCKD